MSLSQMMKHYFSVKEKYKDCLVFYRLGDFYEMFFDDAVKASKLLDLTLTGRDCGLPERAPMCGVPYHAVDAYISKLVGAGEKVAICEQLEDPATAKGIVERGVVRVVTAGTVTSDAGLNEKTNNYICCAYKSGENVALAWADITTGEFCATEYSSDGVNKCISQMVKLNVKEVICNDEMLFASKECREVKAGALPNFSSFPAWAFGYNAAERILLEQFSVKSLSAYKIEGRKNAVSAAGALVEYLKETQMHALKNIDDVKYFVTEKYVQLDGAAMKNLEIFKTLGGGNYGSLLWVLDKTKTGMGSRRLNSALLYPLCDKDEINFRLDGVEELVGSTLIRVALKELLSSVKDIERIAGKISNGNVMPKDCLALSASLAVIPNLKMQLSGFNSAIIKKISEELLDFSEIVSLLDAAINPEPPTQMKDGGYIKEGFNDNLDELRNIKKRAGDLLIAMECRERDATGIRNLRINYNKVFGYYIEVTKSFKDKVPINYQRRQTLANSERYTTDELKELEEKILSSEDRALKLETELYEKIKAVLVENIDKFKTVASAVGLLDMLTAFAEVSKSNRYVRPEIAESREPLVIKEGRHPVIELVSKERFIPNDTLLDEGENRTMIITGPNMAGKSTYMRQTAIIALMAHIGCFVPAKSAQIPLIDRIFTRVGASDNLISDQSTFMVEMIEVAAITRNATKNSLLILDEVGRGTSTYDGLSIAWAVIEYLTDKIGAKTMFATHYHELCELENTADGIKNYKIAVREMGGGIVFLRKIMRGGANKSFGIEVASLAGVPAEVTERAKQILKNVECGDRTSACTKENTEEKPDEIKRILRETDVNNLSPMQAFMLIGDLVEIAKNEKN